MKLFVHDFGHSALRALQPLKGRRGWSGVGPPMGERPADARPLSSHFNRKFQDQRHPKTVADSARNAMVKPLRREQISPVLPGDFGHPRGCQHAEAAWLRRFMESSPLRLAGATTRKAVEAAAISLLLTACAHTPEPKIVTQLVKVPVSVACIPSDLNLDPTYPDTDAALRATAGPDDMLTLLAAGRLLRVQTLAEWKAALKACK